jgi:1,4-alpha-glucan branching enzyme
MTMNHQDAPGSYVLMDFDFGTFKPTANNKWFNTDARHPFNVFFDMNHESSYTKIYLDTVNHYWLNEYKVDGFRFDLSKGFTQTNNPNNVSAWGAYDASRITILKRMADKIWSHSPNAFIILEHFGGNAEEKELSEYRAGEGKGMMLWGNVNYAFSQSTMGYSTDSDFGSYYHSSRGWTFPHLVGYMESHDEERMMFRNINFGNSSSLHNTANVSIALARMKAAIGRSPRLTVSLSARVSGTPSK